MKQNILIIGGGIAGLSTASFLAKSGHTVRLLEKNGQIGGRARYFEAEGFKFDMGPSWYWMPEVFENFYNKFDKTASDFYDLKRLDPSYRVFWEDQTPTDIPALLQDIYNLFESFEKGAAKNLKRFLEEAEYKYDTGMNDLVFKPGRSILEFADWRVVKGIFQLHLASNFRSYINKYFKHPKLRSLLEFPVLFLGALPERTPALYSLMNYADMALGTWYPMGGMHKIIEAFETIARDQGVEIITNCEVQKINITKGIATGVETVQGPFNADIIISGADYEHTDQILLKGESSYSKSYWDKREMAPSCLLYYVGVNRKVEGLKHHNLFFDASFDKHGEEIYTNPSWPSNPLFYVCCPSKTDDQVAPKDQENIFFLMPLAPDLEDSEEMREKYFHVMLKRLNKHIDDNINPDIVYQRSYCVNDFKADYHAFRGNAYGLANTLRQTAILKPKMQHRKIKNVWFTGQLTVPGPGVPPSIISGEIVAKEVLKSVDSTNNLGHLKKDNAYERAI